MPPTIKKRRQVLRHCYDELWAALIVDALAAGRLSPDLDLVALRHGLVGMLTWTLQWRR